MNHSHHKRAGATLILVTVLLPVAFVLAGFAINLSYLQLIQTKTQITADVSATAAGQVYSMTGSESASRLAAQEAAARNPIGNKILPLEPLDFEFGIATRSTADAAYEFTVAPTGNSVRLTTRSLAAGVGGEIEPVFPLFGNAIRFRPHRSSTSTQLDLDIALVLDRSGSMAYSTSEISAYPPAPVSAPAGWDFGDPVPPHARWLDVVAAVQVFMSLLESSPRRELVSLSVYNHNVSTPQPLTIDYPLIASSLTGISTRFTSGGSNVGDGILEGVGAVKDSQRHRPWAVPVIVVLTDGVHNYGTHPVDAAHVARSQDVVVFTLTFSDEAEQALMQSVADVGGGNHYHAVNATQLQDAFRQIAGRMHSLLTR
ncbi:MAG: vWA domain-containing protein [Planctomycetaceae bacterium]